MSDAEPTADALECLIEAERLNVVLDVLQSAVNEAVLRIGKDGLQTRVVGPSKVIMLDINLSASAFADTGSGSFPIGVNLEKLQDYLDKADAGTLVSLSYDERKRMLRIQYDGVDVSMASIDPDTIRNEPDLPDLDLPNHVTVPYQPFRDALDVADMMSSHWYLEGRPDDKAVVVRAEGDTDDGEYVLDGDTITDGKVREAVYSIYSVDYLLGTKPPGLLKQIPSDVEIDIEFGEEFPLWFEFDICGGDGHVKGLIAPRIE